MSNITFKVNKSEYGQNNFDLLPEGDYELELIDIKVAPFAKQGNYKDFSCYDMTWKITENNEVGVGRRIFDRVGLFPHWLNDKKTANFKLEQFLPLIGVEPDDEGNIEIPDADDVLDMNVVVGANVVITEDKNGVYDDRNEVNRYLTPERFANSKKKAKAPEPASTSDATGGNPLFSV